MRLGGHPLQRLLTMADRPGHGTEAGPNVCQLLEPIIPVGIYAGQLPLLQRAHPLREVRERLDKETSQTQILDDDQ